MTDITAESLAFEAAPAKPARKSKLRKRLLIGLALGVAKVGLAYGAYYTMVSSQPVTTDDA